MSKIDIHAYKIQNEVLKLVRLVQSCEQECLVEFNLTATQGYALLALPEHETLNMNELSELIGSANSTTTRMMDQLVKKGLVDRVPSEEDRRVVLVGLTETGRELQKDVTQIYQKFYKSVLHEISDDRHEAILEVLAEINQAISKAFAILN
jgi:DNA-binding MarR family transcriptional regulator